MSKWRKSGRLDFFSFLISGDLNFDFSEKNDRGGFEIIFDELSKVCFYFSSAWIGSRVREGGGSSTPGPVRVAPSTGPERVNQGSQCTILGSIS